MNWTQSVRYKEVKKRYIDEFFYGDQDLWKSSKQPFMDFKHLFRQVVDEYLIPVRTFHADLEGVHYASIHRSADEVKINLHPQLEQAAKGFLVKQLEKDPVTFVKRKLQDHLSKGYTHDDIARHYLVHENVIYKIFNHESVADQTIQYLYNQMHENDSLS